MSKKPRKAMDYEVGYGRPPKATRFKKGQSGNPRGRPKTSKNLDTLLETELEAKITVREGGEEKQFSKREAIIKRIVQGALAGDIRQLHFLFRYLDGRNEPEPFHVTDEDDAELHAMITRMTKGGVDEDRSD